MGLSKKQILISSAVIIPASLIFGVYLREQQQEHTTEKVSHRAPLQTVEELRKELFDKQAYRNELTNLKQQHFILNNEFHKLQEKIKQTQQRMNQNI